MKNFYKILILSIGVLSTTTMISCRGKNIEKTIVGVWETVSIFEEGKLLSDRGESIYFDDDHTYLRESKDRRGEWSVQGKKLTVNRGFIEGELKTWNVSITSKDRIELSLPDEDVVVKLRRINIDVDD